MSYILAPRQGVKAPSLSGMPFVHQIIIILYLGKKHKFRSQAIPEACHLFSKPLVQLYQQVVTDHEQMAKEPFKS